MGVQRTGCAGVSEIAATESRLASRFIILSLLSDSSECPSAAKAIPADGRVNSVSVLAPSADESPLYSVVAESSDISVQDVADIDDYFEHIAARFDGTYDGNELPVDLHATNRPKRKKPR
jgi:hypothetical protein